jgi:zinc protease
MNTTTFTAETLRRREKLPSLRRRGGGVSPAGWFFLSSLLSLCLCISTVQTIAQEQPPAPAAPKTVSIPAVQEKKLPNGLTVAVIQRTSNPLVTVQLLVRSGAAVEPAEKAGLANITADMLTKGTKTRSATQIADDMAFLGSALNSGAGWNGSTVSFTATPDKLEQAMSVMADVVLNPSFKQEELDLLKSQASDELKYNLKQPSFIANYVAAKYSFGEHPAGGTPDSIDALTRDDVAAFHQRYIPQNSVLIFAGDITLNQAAALADKAFGPWKGGAPLAVGGGVSTQAKTQKDLRSILVVDLPNSGQAAVTYALPVGGVGRRDKRFYDASVLNSVLGGGYSSRLNYEIRIKRGLSYGAGSSFGWRSSNANFNTRAQTKNESAAQVAELTMAEIKRLSSDAIAADELTPRKSVLTGNFGRNLETTAGLASAISDLYSFGIPTSELNNYMANVNAVTDAQIRDFAKASLSNGDLIIVGDYAVFKDDLAKRFPGMKIDVVKLDEIDLKLDNLRK